MKVNKTMTQQSSDNTAIAGISEELQKSLDGMFFGDAVNEGLISPVQFRDDALTYTGNNGSETYDRTVLVCKEGEIVVSASTAEELIDWADRLGDLVFRIHEPREYKGRMTNRTFRLGKPGGSVTVSSSINAVGQEKAEATA